MVWIAVGFEEHDRKLREEEQKRKYPYPAWFCCNFPKCCVFSWANWMCERQTTQWVWFKISINNLNAHVGKLIESFLSFRKFSKAYWVSPNCSQWANFEPSEGARFIESITNLNVNVKMYFLTSTHEINPGD